MSADDTAQQEAWDWDELWARISRVLWCLAPEDFQRFAHRDLVFGVTMQDLTAAIYDAMDPGADLSVWLRDEYRPPKTAVTEPEQLLAHEAPDR